MSDWVIKGVFTNLTPAEKWFFLRHPHLIDEAFAARDEAFATTRRHFPGARAHNDSADAFRHAYFSALLARDMGVDNAQELTDAHEAYGDNPAGERQMDLANNAVGIRIGGANPNGSNVRLQNEVLAELNAGRLMTRVPTPGQAYSAY